MASSPKSSLKGVNFVALDSEVLCDHMTEVSSSAHFLLGSAMQSSRDALEDYIVRSFDEAIGLRVSY